MKLNPSRHGRLVVAVVMMVVLAIAAPALGVANAMTPGSPYITGGGYASAVVTVVQTTNYNGDPCSGSSYLYSRGILEGKRTLGFGTVATTSWSCRVVNSYALPTGCIDPDVNVTYHSKGNWRNENATNTTNVSVNVVRQCSP